MTRILFALLLLLASALPSSASLLTLTRAELTIAVAGLPDVSEVRFPALPVLVSSGGGSFSIAGPIAGLVETGAAATLPLVDRVDWNLTLTGLSVNCAGSCLGIGNLAGEALVNILAIFNLTVPLGVVGTTTGTDTGGIGSLNFVISGVPWSTGAGGFDNRTPTNHEGEILLRSPFAVHVFDGNLPLHDAAGIASLSLQFFQVPERGTLALMVMGVAGLLVYGSTRL